MVFIVLIISLRMVIKSLELNITETVKKPFDKKRSLHLMHAGD